MSVDKTTNEITKLAAQMDPSFMFASASIGAVGGQCEKTRMSALEMCAGLSNPAFNALKAAGVVLAAGAVGGCGDAMTTGVGAIAAVTATVLGGGNNKKGPTLS